MPDHSLQYLRELEGLEALIDSDEFYQFAKGFPGAENVRWCMLQYKEQLCLHDWHTNQNSHLDRDGFQYEQCKKCKAERETAIK